MNKNDFDKIEQHMLSFMKDSAHDEEHAYRVLYLSLNIAKDEKNVDYDVLIAAAMLHDIGRAAQFNNPKLCHGQVGGAMAKSFLTELGWCKEKSARVENAIVAHRYRENNPPTLIEEKILFDADKLDVAGTMGIARTIFYNGALEEPLYTKNDDGSICNDGSDGSNTFFTEYEFKLKDVYDKFYTKRAMELAKQRQQAAIDFYDSLVGEIQQAYQWTNLLDEHIK